MILVFVGAGGSAAVDPEQYPVTRRFFEKLEKDVTTNPLFQAVCQKQQESKEALDIEDVLEELDKLQSHFTGVTESLGGQLYEGGGIRFSSQDIGTTRRTLRRIKNESIIPLNDKIKAQVYDFYGTPPPNEKLSVWIRLLKELSRTDPCLEIFTTNYDLVLEEAIEQAGVHVNEGLDSKGRKTRLDVDFWKPPKEHLGKYGLLTKLHGSVDWQRENGAVIVGSSHFTGEHENHCLLYPGHKGAPAAEPFITFHDHLRNVVRREYSPLTAALFIGFAFRDDYINTILKDFPPKAETFFFTLVGEEEPPDNTPPDRAPHVESCIHFRNGLREENVRMCLDTLRK